MKLIEATFKPIFERWDDPGDYPNALASGPLPSFTYCSEIEGHALIELETSDLPFAVDDVDTMNEMADIAQDECPAQVKKWSRMLTIRPWATEGKLVFAMIVEDFDSSTVQVPDDE